MRKTVVAEAATPGASPSTHVDQTGDFGWSGRKAYTCPPEPPAEAKTVSPSAGETARSKIGRPVLHCAGAGRPVEASKTASPARPPKSMKLPAA